MSDEIIDTILVGGLRRFGKYDKLNSIKIKIDRNKIVANLAHYENFKYCFIFDWILFSTAISNDTNIIFITSTGLSNAHQALINGIWHKTIAVINPMQIENWYLVKGELKWTSTNIKDSEFPSNADHFAFGLKNKKLTWSNIFSIFVVRWKRRTHNIQTKRKNIPLLSFQIQIIK